MGVEFPVILSQLRSGIGGRCEHAIGSAGIADETNWDRLRAQYDEAVRTFTATYGEPAKIQYGFPGKEIEQATCWEQSGKILYALLSYLDNTRIRRLTLGVSTSDELTIVAGDSDWWSRPPW